MEYRQLSTEERYIIAAIADTLHRDRGTLYREIARNKCAHDGFYLAMFRRAKSVRSAAASRRNPRYTPADSAIVEQLLRANFSPEQVVVGCAHSKFHPPSSNAFAPSTARCRACARSWMHCSISHPRRADARSRISAKAPHPRFSKVLSS